MSEHREGRERNANGKVAFESLNILMSKWLDGSFTEIIDDWKWIFSYSRRHKWAIVFYTVMREQANPPVSRQLPMNIMIGDFVLLKYISISFRI